MKIKVKPKKYEVDNFKIDEMRVDDFWKDLYEYNPKKKKNDERKNYIKRTN